MKKTKVGILYGGKSFEHEVSKMTAESILQNIDRDKFEVSEIYIDKDGSLDESKLNKIDVAFLAVHGPNCEDGVLQSYLESKGAPYTGAGVEASRVNMNKIEQHKIFSKAGLRTTPFLSFRIGERREDLFQNIEKTLHYPLFVKPNDAGSSIGSNKVKNKSELDLALDEALKCDDWIIIEQAVEKPRELELAILGNEDLTISEPGEILTQGKFYTYDSKYFHPFETETVAENLTDKQISTLKDWTARAYKVTGCKGYARIDFLMAEDGTIYINEINTLPGFTKTSMFPKMMATSGISYKELITKIIDLALK